MLPPNFFWQDLGTGPETVLLLHSYLVDSTMYRELTETLGSSYRFIIPDMRGVGQNRDIEGPYNIEQNAADALALLDHLGLERVHVAGYSMGGLTSQALYKLAPQRVRSLVLGATYSFKPCTAIERIQGTITRNLLQRVGPRGMARLIPAEAGGGQMDAARLRWFRQKLTEQRTEVAVDLAHSLFKFDSRTWLNRITVPTLVIGGLLDMITPMHHTYQLAGQIPGAKLKVYERGGHELIFQFPDRFALEVHQFWQSVNRRRRITVQAPATAPANMTPIAG
jgi:pimeloyl-ACP methyl ester carboxylesterase